MYYTVYKITNLLNHKYYIGVHRTLDLNDLYMGSGKLIRLSITKHGLENFKKEYLAVFDNPEEMFKMESELVNEEFVKSENSYNMSTGGHGGCIISGSKGGLKTAERFKNDQLFQSLTKERCSSHLNKMKLQGKCLGGPKFAGKKHTPETKAKIGSSISKKCQGESNSQFGTMWITDGVSNKKILKEDHIPDGWKKGRSFNG
jgi:hypothetical protein